MMAFPTWSRFCLHFRGKHPTETRPAKEEVELDELPEGFELKTPEKPKKPPTEERVGVYKEMAKPTTILYDILTSFPGIKKDIIDEVMSWSEYEALTPMAVGHLLNNMAGVPKGAVNVVPQKYGLALQKAAKEGDANLQMLLAGWSRGEGGAPYLGGYQSYGVFPFQGPTPYGTPPYGTLPGYRRPEYYEAEPRVRGRREAEEIEDKAVKELQEQVNYLSTQLTRQEEEAKEEKRRREFQELVDKHTREVERIGVEHGKEIERLEKNRERDIASVKEDYHSTLSSLESKIESAGGGETVKLKEEIRELRQRVEDERVLKLEGKIADLEKKEPSSPTELGVIQSTAKEAILAMKSAGADLKTAFMAGRVREEHLPGRRSPEERKKAGEELVSRLERSEEEIKSMNGFFARY